MSPEVLFVTALTSIPFAYLIVTNLWRETRDAKHTCPKCGRTGTMTETWVNEFRGQRLGKCSRCGIVKVAA
jgi:hypothetical protein